MRNTIIDIQSNIKQGKYQSEAAVSQGIVQRILTNLGWPIFNTTIVTPEYKLDTRRVDFALCHPANKPVIFIEIKQIGQSDGAERQLFEYAFLYGIPFAILTDGQEWHFFLPAEPGEISDRRVYKLDFLEREIDDIVAILSRYLSYSNVISGKALDFAKKDYRSIHQKREAQKTLPEAWKRLVDEGDELLIDLLIDKVESLCGFKTNPDQVTDFLSNNLVLKENHEYPVVIKIPDHKKETNKDPVPTQIGFELFGEYHSAKTAREIMFQALNLFADRDETFLDRYASLPKHGRTRRYIAKSRRELNPPRPDLAKQYSYEFRKGWFVDINLSKKSIDQILRLACQIANIKYGKDFVVFM